MELMHQWQVANERLISTLYDVLPVNQKLMLVPWLPQQQRKVATFPKNQTHEPNTRTKHTNQTHEPNTRTKVTIHWRDVICRTPMTVPWAKPETVKMPKMNNVPSQLNSGSPEIIRIHSHAFTPSVVPKTSPIAMDAASRTDEMSFTKESPDVS